MIDKGNESLPLRLLRRPEVQSTLQPVRAPQRGIQCQESTPLRSRRKLVALSGRS